MARPEVTGRKIERAAFTIDEFCWAHGFSRASYYNMKVRGEGPEEARVGRHVIITAEAAARWRRRRTSPARRAKELAPSS